MTARPRKQTILIVDDSEMNRAILSDMLCDEYEILESENGIQAMEQLRSSSDISLMLLDLNMPEIDGYTVLQEMGLHHFLEDIPVIIISAETGAEQIEKAYELGASDFITRPFDALIVHKRVVNTLLLYSKQKRLVELVAAQIYESQFQSNMMIEILGHIVEFRNGESGMHIRHVHVLTELFLNRMNTKGDTHFSSKEVSLIGTASALHDIGKIAIPDEIINKPGRFTDEEFAIMKTHAAQGAEMLESMVSYQDQPLVKVAYQIARWHHERWDGRGYPDGLKGDQIPMAAQVVALADVYDALTSPRVYKPALPHQEAVQMILDGKCGQFSPTILSCLSDLGTDIPQALAEAERDNGAALNIFNVTQEILHKEDLSVSKRTLQLLEQERIRNDFFASLNEELQFEFTMAPASVTLSPYCANKLGFPEVIPDPLRDRRVLDLLGAEAVQNLSDLLRSTSPGHPSVSGDFPLHLPDGPRWYHIDARATWSADEPPRYTGAIGKATDVHDTFVQMETLERLASSDQLTNLLNRATARKQIENRLKERPNGKFALVIFDLDFFKAANDNRGHLFGDSLLVHVAEKLRQSVRGGDIVCRAGGDEFLFFLEYKDQGDPNIAVERIHTNLCDEFEGFRISLSMGVAQTEVVGHDYETLFHAADAALYSVKKSTRGRVAYYSPEMEDALSAITPIDYNVRPQEGPSPGAEKEE